ncbi:uncharacterized protein LOC111895862 [Lactuca sativa]|uniref:uncharacterized protein LOC111895862 n=1 Tax=Lactuca sativa TaxID=4236 RepID=UPI000CD8633C|nr:uncharacterized protein LOC111895862 [Lactuca sativa]
MSKLDRFLCCCNFISSHPFFAVTALPREYSDHSPITLISGNCTNDPYGTPNEVLVAKLRILKNAIKKWKRIDQGNVLKETNMLKTRVNELDMAAEYRNLSTSEITELRNGRKKILELENIHQMDLRQKSKTEVNPIKTEAWKFFQHKFTETHKIIPNSEEIKNAIWSCGGDKAPGPDGFTFQFMKRYWHMMKDDIMRFIKDFESTELMGKGCNSSFITLAPKVKDPITLVDYRPISLIRVLYKIISKTLTNRLKSIISSVIGESQTAFIEGRNILNGPVIINETCAWAKKAKQKMFPLKVDLDKSFDSIHWGYLDSIMLQMGFGVKWRSWISGCLTTARASVLVNGSPTDEFVLSKGVRQGDPISPLHFIIAMEGLNIALKEACQKSVIQGLKVNFQKSKLYGIGVSDCDLAASERVIGCEASSFPFSYLGVPVTWDKVIAHKENGGLGVGSLRAANLALLTKWIWRIKEEKNTIWKNIITAIHNLDRKPINKLVKKSIHGIWRGMVKAMAELEDLNTIPANMFVVKVGNGEHTSFWHETWIGVEPLASWFPNIFKLDKKKSASILERRAEEGFVAKWKKAPSSPVELMELSQLQSIIRNFIFSSELDSWKFSLTHDRIFRVDTLRYQADLALAVSSPKRIEWIHMVPLKILVFLWRVSMDRILTADALSHRGINVNSVTCPLCQLDLEKTDHLLANYSYSGETFRLIFEWCGIEPQKFVSVV